MSETITTTSTADPIPANYIEAPLPELVFGIELEFNRAERAADTMLGHAIKCGQMLRAAKERVPHGSWMKWIQDNTSIPHSTATTFMHLAANSQRVGNLGTIRGALKLLADGRKKEPTRQLSESYVPFDGESPPAPSPRLPQITLEADIVEPVAPATAPPQAPLETTVETEVDIEPEDQPAPAVAPPTASPAPSLIETSEVALTEILALLQRLRPAEITELHRVIESRWMKPQTQTAAP